MAIEVRPSDERDNDVEMRCRAMLNDCHFEAMAIWFQRAEIENEILNNYYFKKIRPANEDGRKRAEMWFKNSWNTEVLLGMNKKIIENTGQSFSMQWAFPQAYYCLFGGLMAHFAAVGHTETSHTSVLRKFGQLMKDGKLPESVSLFCEGPKHEVIFHGIEKPEYSGSAYHLDIADEVSIRHHICTFLSATRKRRLEEKAPTLGLKNKKGEKKKALSKDDWITVSNSIGLTTVADHLYRKRIKGNYQDIETFNSPYFEGHKVLTNLCITIDRLNLVNECYAAKAIGIDEFDKMVKSHLKKINNDFLRERLEIVRAIIT